MTGAWSLRWLMYKPPCCLNDGSIWFLKLFTVLLFTVSSLSLFQVSTTRCVKKYFRTFSLQCCLRMVREWPLRPVAVRSWKKSSRFTPSKLCIILNTLIKSLLSRLISSESSFVFDSLTLYSSSPISIDHLGHSPLNSFQVVDVLLVVWSPRLYAVF